MEMPLVSVLMTAYNREQFIGEAIESVLASKYQNWELVIVDDCSTDNTVAIAKEYADNDDRIYLYVNEKNLGDYPNRNKAASYAKGDYLKYLDADDLIYPYSLQIMVEAMEKFPEAGLGLEEPFYDRLYEPFPLKREPSWIYKTHFITRGVIYVGPSAAIIRTDTFKAMGGFSGTRYIGDTELWLRIAAYTPVVFFQPALVFWRQHEGQEIASERTNKSAIILRHSLNLRLIREGVHLLNRSEQRLAVNKCNRRLLYNAVNIILNKRDISTVIYLLSHSEMSFRDLFLAVFH